MLTLKLLGRLINALNAGAAPWQIAGGLVLGFLLGLIPGWPVHVMALLVLILLLDVNLTLAGVGALTAAALAWLADPWLDRLGAWLLAWESLRGAYTVLYNSPPLALTRFNNTVVMGATVLGTIIAAALFPLLIWGVRLYRARLLVWVEKLGINASATWG
jgi:uncharacterized protein (TIGR03546 family)